MGKVNAEMTSLSLELHSTEVPTVNRPTAPSTGAHVLEKAYYIIGTFGIIDNLLVIYVLIRQRKQFLRRNCYKFILHQSLVDFIASVFMVLTTAFHQMTGLPETLYYEVRCRVWLTNLFLWGPFMVSSYNLCAMTIERYFAVLKPVAYKTSPKNVIFTVGVISVWSIGMIFNALMKIITSDVVEGRCRVLYNWSSPQARQGFGIFTIVLEYFVPLLILIFCYSHMIYLLRQMSLVVKPTTGPADYAVNQASAYRFNARKNIIKTLLWVSICFVFCWTWNQVYFLLMNLGYELYTDTAFYKFTVIIAFLNCCVNPIVYLVKDASFRKAARSFLKTDSFSTEETGTEWREVISKLLLTCWKSLICHSLLVFPSK